MSVFTLLLYSDNMFSIKAIFILYKFTVNKRITLLWYIEYIDHGSKNGLLYDLTYFGANREPLPWTETKVSQIIQYFALVPK